MCLCIKVCLCDLWLVRQVYVQKTFPLSVPAHLSASWSDIGRHRWLSIACILGRKLDEVIFYRIASLLQFYIKKMSSEICVSPQNADFSAHVKIGQVAQIITNPNNNITATHIYLVPPSSSLNIQLLTV